MLLDCTRNGGKGSWGRQVTINSKRSNQNGTENNTCKTIYRVANLAQIQQITCIESLPLSSSLTVFAVSHGSFGNPNWAERRDEGAGPSEGRTTTVAIKRSLIWHAVAS